jgi:hypothetical protein
MPDTHAYGGADDDNRQTPTASGFHGEGKAPLAEVPPENKRTATVAGGSTVVVEEASGIAVAEAAGNTRTQGDAQETAGSG